MSTPSQWLRRLAPLLLAATACVAAAQSYPSRPIKIVVPFAAGSGSDIYARLIAEDWRVDLNQSVVIENKAGGSAMIGTQQVAKSAPDGYTLLVATNTGHSANSAMFKKLPYDPVADFTGIGRVLNMPYVLVVPKDSPITSVANLIQRARAKPASINYGYGNSSGQVLAAEFARQARISTTGVAYKSMPPAMTDLIGGQVDYLFADVSSALPFLKAGTIKALGFSLLNRSRQLPDVPAIAETPGMEGFELTSWVGLLSPAGTPPQVVSTLNAQLRKTLAKPEIRDKLIGMGAEVTPSSPAEMDQFVKDQLASWGTKIRNAGIEPQ
jgi:tripartite-type tricarboxylate transporter receptor subunit TctC